MDKVWNIIRVGKFRFAIEEVFKHITEVRVIRQQCKKSFRHHHIFDWIPRVTTKRTLEVLDSIVTRDAVFVLALVAGKKVYLG